MAAGISVGDFSRMTHLSVKTLRHYHQVGLLEPAEVDPGNGYRYYSSSQVPKAQVIRRLRDLDMPVPAVKAVLEAPDQAGRNALISDHLGRLESELSRTHAAVESLRNLLDGRSMTARIEHRTVAATPAVAISEIVAREDVLAWWQGALGELAATVRAQRLTPSGPSGGLYSGEIFQQNLGLATVFIPIEGAVREIGRVRSYAVPAAELAVIVHRGSLDDVDLSYGELGSYAAKHEISVEGPLREYYLHDPVGASDPTSWQTEICWPIFRADDDREVTAADT
jgi:DNA-binding transcriptional MerR regulator